MMGALPPKPPGFIAFAQALIADRAARWPPEIMPAAESALESHPCVALSSAQLPLSITGERSIVDSAKRGRALHSIE